ncbi:hypothetical protein R1sor_023448 [Riccia sorocarpa]|uniref:Exostosin GT47 domain-containing protein n=1 Tax=Riccia sorocarpa TaxID=122646 RepID=A0ABD3GMQ1_9MARC
MKLLVLLRIRRYRRTTLVPAICLLTFICLWMLTSITLVNISYESLSHDQVDGQCHNTSCTVANESAVPQTEVSLSELPFYIKLRTSLLLTVNSRFAPLSRASENLDSADLEEEELRGNVDSADLEEEELRGNGGAGNSNQPRSGENSVKNSGRFDEPWDSMDNAGSDSIGISGMDESRSKTESVVEQQEHQSVQLQQHDSTAVPATRQTDAQDVMFKHKNMTAQELWAAGELEKIMRRVRNSGLPQLNSNWNQASKSVYLQANDKPLQFDVRDGTPATAMPDPALPSCHGRYIKLYDLPSKFNADVIARCAIQKIPDSMSLCDYLQHQGIGPVLSPSTEEKILVPEGSWHQTFQFALEPIFHARMKSYECLTTNDSMASLFYIPFYAALDGNHWEFAENATNEDRDALPLELLHWLEAQESWRRNKGLDHVLLLGEITWDFRRKDGSTWGSRLLELPEMAAPTKLLVERQVWDPNEIGIPYPTSFHPNSGDEIRTWQSHYSTMDLFLHSHFCMQPPGDSPTRRSVFDSLIGGCIPVLFNTYTAYYQYPWHLPEDAKSFSVYVPSEDVMSGRANVVEILKTISPEERAKMRARIIQEILPGLLYSKPGAKHPPFRDAFDISIDGLLQRVANLRADKGAVA